MALTINRINGTGWPPSGAADTCALAVFAEIGSWFNTSNSIDIKVNWASTFHPSIGNSLPTPASDQTYAEVKTQLLAQTDSLTNNIKSTAYSSLPASDPSGAPTTYKARALWLAMINNTNFSTFFGAYNEIFLNSNYTFDLDPTGLTCDPGTYGMYQVILHEARELLGGWSELTGNMSPADLFSYSSANTRCFTAANRYFSWDDGVTNLGDWSSSGTDLLDWVGTQVGQGWQGTSTGSPFQANSPGGDPQLIRYIDGQTLSVLGLPMSARGLMVCGFPTNTVAPSISGTGIVGQTLTRTLGTWVGQSAITTIGNWQRNGSDIGGATNSTYVLQGADAGTNITWKDSSSNVIGANTQSSNTIAVSMASGNGRVGLFQIRR